MKFKFNNINLSLYILLWAAYHIGLYFQIQGSAFFLLITLIWSFFDMIHLFITPRKRSTFFTIYTIFFMMLVFYGLLLIVGGNALNTIHGRMNNSQYIYKILPSLLPFYTFYRSFIEKPIVLSNIFYWIIPFFAVAISGYYMGLRASHGMVGDDVEEVVNNGSYYILGLIPFVCLSKKRIIHLLFFAVFLFLITIAYKRGPIFISLVCMIYYFFNVTKTSGKKISTALLVIVAFAVGYVFFIRFFNESDLMQGRWESTLGGSSSGRDSILSLMIDVFLNSNFIQLLFGHGAYGTIVQTGRLAHNDWMQILIDQGIVGVFIFAVFCWNLIRQWKLSDNNCNAKLSYGMFLIIFLLTSIFSMAFDRIPLYEMIVLSAIVSQNDLKTSYQSSLE